MSFNLTEKPEIFGIPVIDFYILVGVEIILFLIALYLINFNLIFGGSFFVFFGSIVFVFINFKKFLPEHFFINLIKFTMGQRIYYANPRLSTDNPLIRAIANEKTEDNH
jgi:hypothetical protein